MKNIAYLTAFLLVAVLSCQSQTDSKKTSKPTTNTTPATSEAEMIPVLQLEGAMPPKDIVGPMIIHGKFAQRNGFDGKYIRLYETEGKDIFIIDSVKIVNGSFELHPQEVHVGLHRIGIIPDERSLGEIILNPNEKEITITYGNNTFKSNFSVSGSKENEGWTAYMKDRAAQKTILSQIKKSGEERSVKLKKLYASQKDLKIKEEQFAKDYVGTFFSKMVKRFQSPYRWDKEKYWDDIDFKDPTLIHSRVYSNRIMDYMRNHAKKENTDKDPTLGYYNAVDIIAQKVKEGKNDKVLEFMLYTMSEGMFSSGHEDVSLYVIDNYFYGDACGDSEISELFKRKAAGIRNLQIGNKPPNFKLSDYQGNPLELQDVIDANDYTLVFFWASFCHKCEAEIPLLKTVYNEYHKNRFEVVGVSVDLQRSPWIEAIKENQFRWKNCSEVKGWKGKVSGMYRVSKTPSMFLINGKGELILRPKTAKELQNFLRKEMQ